MDGPSQPPPLNPAGGGGKQNRPRQATVAPVATRNGITNKLKPRIPASRRRSTT